MSDLDDLHLNRWPESSEPPRGRTSGRFALIALLIGTAAVAAYAWWYYRARQTPEEVRALTEQAVAAPGAPSAPVAEPGENIDLPPLAETDAIVRELVAKVSAHPKVVAWLATDQLLRNFTVTIATMANGKAPTQQLAKLRPAEKFQVLQTGGSIVIDARSYRRYDTFADAVGALDARGTARLYATLKPRIQDAYRELGEAGEFDQTFARAIRQLVQTPVIDASIPLASKTVAYEYADPRLQSLPAVQRQFLRMGPRNVRIIQAKLREIAPLLGMTDVH